MLLTEQYGSSLNICTKASHSSCLEDVIPHFRAKSVDRVDYPHQLLKGVYLLHKAERVVSSLSICTHSLGLHQQHLVLEIIRTLWTLGSEVLFLAICTTPLPFITLGRFPLDCIGIPSSILCTPISCCTFSLSQEYYDSNFVSPIGPGAPFVWLGCQVFHQFECIRSQFVLFQGIVDIVVIEGLLMKRDIDETRHVMIGHEVRPLT
ncbi:hypothetical protein Tco_0764570 [Tanacetum coccineum]